MDKKKPSVASIIKKLQIGDKLVISYVAASPTCSDYRVIRINKKTVSLTTTMNGNFFATTKRHVIKIKGKPVVRHFKKFLKEKKLKTHLLLPKNFVQGKDSKGKESEDYIVSITRSGKKLF